MCFLEVVFADYLTFFRFTFALGLEVEENKDRFDNIKMGKRRIRKRKVEEI